MTSYQCEKGEAAPTCPDAKENRLRFRRQNIPVTPASECCGAQQYNVKATIGNFREKSQPPEFMDNMELMRNGTVSCQAYARYDIYAHDLSYANARFLLNLGLLQQSDGN